MTTLSNVKRFERMVETYKKRQKQVDRLEGMLRVAETSAPGYRFEIHLGEYQMEAESELVVPAIKKRLYQAKLEIAEMDQLMAEMLELCGDEADE